MHIASPPSSVEAHSGGQQYLLPCLHMHWHCFCITLQDTDSVQRAKLTFSITGPEGR